MTPPKSKKHARLLDRIVLLIVTFSYSPHYIPHFYADQDVEEIVELLLDIKDKSTFVLLVQALIDINICPGDGISWMQDPVPRSITRIKKGPDQRTVRNALRVLISIR